MAKSKSNGQPPEKVSERLEVHIEAQRSTLYSAYAIVDIVAQGMPDTATDEPEFKSALCVARDLLNKALEGLDIVSLQKALDAPVVAHE